MLNQPEWDMRAKYKHQIATKNLDHRSGHIAVNSKHNPIKPVNNELVSKSKRHLFTIDQWAFKNVCA